MRLTPLVACLVLGSTGVAAASGYDTPEAMLTALYAPYLADEYADSDAFRSRALQALFDADAAATPEGDVGAIDFDPFIGGQEWVLSDFQIGAVAITGNTATAEVSFKNFDEPETLTYDLVNEDGWKIDNVTSTGDNSSHSLIDIFKNAEY